MERGKEDEFHMVRGILGEGGESQTSEKRERERGECEGGSLSKQIMLPTPHPGSTMVGVCCVVLEDLVVGTEAGHLEIDALALARQQKNGQSKSENSKISTAFFFLLFFSGTHLVAMSSLGTFQPF